MGSHGPREYTLRHILLKFFAEGQLLKIAPTTYVTQAQGRRRNPCRPWIGRCMGEIQSSPECRTQEHELVEG